MEFLSESIQESTIHNSTQCCARWVFGIFLPKQTFSHQDQISPVSHYTQCSGCRFPVGPQPIFPPSVSVSPIIFSPPALLLPFLDLLTLGVNKTAQCPRSIKKFSALDPHTRSHPRSNRHSPPEPTYNPPCGFPQRSGKAFLFTSCPELPIPSLCWFL